MAICLIFINSLSNSLSLPPLAENGKRLEEELLIFGDLCKLVRHEIRSGLMVARTTGKQ